MQTHLEDHKGLGVLHDCAWLFFTVHISAESCTVNLLYGISKLLCKIDQRELEFGFKYNLGQKNYTLQVWPDLGSNSLLNVQT